MSIEKKMLASPAVPHYDDGMVRVEGHVVEPGLLARHHGLGANRVVLVQVQIEYVDL